MASTFNRRNPWRAPHVLACTVLVAGLIEARSCERFSVLAEHVSDPELRDFYQSLFESEARHHSTYVRLACDVAPEEIVRTRGPGGYAGPGSLGGTESALRR